MVRTCGGAIVFNEKLDFLVARVLTFLAGARGGATGCAGGVTGCCSGACACNSGDAFRADFVEEEELEEELEE